MNKCAICGADLDLIQLTFMTKNEGLTKCCITHIKETELTDYIIQSGGLVSMNDASESKQAETAGADNLKTNYFVIEDKLPSLNEYVAMCRANKFKGAKFKRDTEYLISLYISSAKAEKTLKPTDKPIIVHFEWHEKTKKRDTDNIASAKKFILDAMQKMLIIPNDNRKHLKGFTDTFIDDTSNFVVVRIEETD